MSATLCPGAAAAMAAIPAEDAIIGVLVEIGELADRFHRTETLIGDALNVYVPIAEVARQALERIAAARAQLEIVKSECERLSNVAQ